MHMDIASRLAFLGGRHRASRLGRAIGARPAGASLVTISITVVVVVMTVLAIGGVLPPASEQVLSAPFRW